MFHKDSESENESPQFSHYEPSVLRMMERMGYDLTNGPGWTWAKKEEHYFDLSFRKGSPWLLPSNSQGFGLYVNSNSVSLWVWKSLYHNHSSGASSWESDISVGNLFEELSVNMVSTSHLEDGDEETIQSDTNPWIKHLNTLWDVHFKQREPPTEDKVTQINLGDEANPKPIFISEAYHPPRKKI